MAIFSEPEFDFGKGEEKAKEGMDKAFGAARSHEWLHDMGRWFMGLPIGEEFTPDDAIKANGLPEDGNNKAVGAWFSALANAKFIQWTGATYRSERVTRHTGMNRVWRKLR